MDILLLVDCQYDFMEGGKLPVDGATAKMDALVEYVNSRTVKYDRIVFTLDYHPFNHCSFKENGGQWPAHCLAYSRGSAIYDPLMKMAQKSGVHTHFIQKGVAPFTENYSVFGMPEAQELFAPFCLYGGDESVNIEVGGIALDYCVKDTIKDGIILFPTANWWLLNEFSPAIGGMDGATKAIGELTNVAREASSNFRLLVTNY